MLATNRNRWQQKLDKGVVKINFFPANFQSKLKYLKLRNSKNIDHNNKLSN